MHIGMQLEARGMAMAGSTLPGMITAQRRTERRCVQLGNTIAMPQERGWLRVARCHPLCANILKRLQHTVAYGGAVQGVVREKGLEQQAPLSVRDPMQAVMMMQWMLLKATPARMWLGQRQARRVALVLLLGRALRCLCGTLLSCRSCVRFRWPMLSDRCLGPRGPCVIGFVPYGAG